MLQSIFGHRDIVTCITFCPERGLYGIPGDGLIASGSHDATVLLWRWSGKETQGLFCHDLHSAITVQLYLSPVKCSNPSDF